MMMDDRQAVTEIMSWRRAVHQSVSNEMKRGSEWNVSVGMDT